MSQHRGAERGDLEPFAEGVEACVQRKGLCCCSRYCCSETRRTSCNSRCLHRSRCRSLWRGRGRESRLCSCRGCSARRSAIAISSHYSWARAIRRSCSSRLAWARRRVPSVRITPSARRQKAYVRMAHAREPERLVPHLAEILCPVRLVVGSAPHSGGIPAAEVRVLAARLPAFTVDTVSGAGHFLYEEQPQAVFAAIERAETAAARPPK